MTVSDLVAARRNRGAGRWAVRGALRPEATRYAHVVLAAPPGPGTDALVGAALVRAARTLPRGIDLDGLNDHVRHAVRAEVYRRQRRARWRHPRSAAVPIEPASRRRRGRWVVAAAVLAVLAVAATWIAGADRDDEPPAALPPSDVPVPEGVVLGRVVVEAADGDRAYDGGLQVLAQRTDGSAVHATRTEADGRFELAGLEQSTYQVAVPDAPSGYRAVRDAAGTSSLVAFVDLTDEAETSVVLRLVRSP